MSKDISEKKDKDVKPEKAEKQDKDTKSDKPKGEKDEKKPNRDFSYTQNREISWLRFDDRILDSSASSSARSWSPTSTSGS